MRIRATIRTNPWKAIRALLLSLLILFVMVDADAQNFPVRVTPVITPPYSPFLTDYTEAGSDKLTLQILLSDISVSNYACKLRLTIEGVNISITTNPNFAPAPLLLQGGSPEILYGSDIADYFNPANLVYKGITQRDIEKNGNKLPEGIYRFSFEVLDYNRNFAVSNKGSASAWMLLNDPPFINLPANNSKLRPFDPQNVVFQWTPRHSGSPNSAFTTEYDVKLVEIWPKGRNPYDAINTSRPIFELTTDATMVVYGPAETPLVLGREYAMQVRARDIGGKDVFKNQGYSEVIKFTYGDECPLPADLLADDIGIAKARVKWQSNGLNTGYVLLYREKKEGAEWFEEHTSQSYYSVKGLRSGTTYEYQVAGECLSYRSAPSPIYTLTTLAETTTAFVCGEPTAIPPPDGSPPLPVLMINDLIKAGGFDIVVTKASGANGKFTGTGDAVIPWFNNAKVRVTFENITVNTSYQLTGGSINTVWNKDSKLLKTIEQPTAQSKSPSTEFKSEIATFEADSTVTITGAIIAVTPNSDGDIVVLTNDGTTVTLEKGKSYAIADQVGNGYVVDKEGNISKTTATDALAAGERGTRQYSDDPNLTVVFSKIDNRTRFGWDDPREGVLEQNYQQAENGKLIAWKALPARQTDYLKVVAEGSANLNDVKFSVEGIDSQEVTQANGDLTLTGKDNGSIEELLAIYHSEDTTKNNLVLGKVNLVSYESINKKLVLIKVNETSFTSSGPAIQDKLNEIYSQGIVSWNVSSDIETIQVDGINESSLDDGGSTLLSNYTSEMKQVLNAYLEEGALETDTYYIFLVTKSKSGATLGYMPRSKQAGFIFTEAHLSDDELIHTIAHELGHGAFHLKHTFTEFPSLSKGSSDNLMDYSLGSRLNKYQWDDIHNPESVIGLFEDDSEGELADRLIACLTGAAIDVGLQYTFKWVELWMDDKPVGFTDYQAIFGAMDASQVVVSAGIACAASTFPIFPSTKNKLLVAVIAGLGDGAYAFANNIYVQYDELEKKYPSYSFGHILDSISWRKAFLDAGTNFAITSIATGVTLYAKGNPKFVNFAKRLEEKIKNQGTAFLERAGLTSEAIDLLLKKLGIKRIQNYLLQLPRNSVTVRGGKTTVADHWLNNSLPFELDAALAQQIRQTTGSIFDMAEEAAIKRFNMEGFNSFLTKYGSNNGMDALLANATDLARATRIIILEVKSSATKSVPFNVDMGSGYGGFQLDDTWLDGVINKMVGPEEVNKAIQNAGRALRRIFDTNPAIIEKYIIEVDKQGAARILKVN